MDMPKLPTPSSQAFLAGCALFFIGSMGLLMCFHEVPRSNHDFLVFILGALSGATTAAGVIKGNEALSAPRPPPIASVAPVKPDPLI